MLLERNGLPPLVAVALLTLTPGGGVLASTEANQTACAPAQGEPIALAAAKLYVEYNATDEDLGVHGSFDSDGYSELCVYDPNGSLVLAGKPQGQLKDLTIGEVFFESREPPASELTFADLETNLPEGRYEANGTTFDGKGLTGAATFTHDVPAAPTIVAPDLAEDEKKPKMPSFPPMTWWSNGRM